MAKDIIMPALGMAQETGKLVEWLKAEGDEVQKGEPLMVVETDKTTLEIEAPATGRLVNVELRAGEETSVGTRIAVLIAQGESAPSATELVGTESSPQSSSAVEQNRDLPQSTPLAKSVAAAHELNVQSVPFLGDKIRSNDVVAHLQDRKASSHSSRTLASPKARRLASEREVTLAELVGTGPDGAVLAIDVSTFVGDTPIDRSNFLSAQSKTNSRIWQVMTKRLTESWQTIPHFYLNVEANVANLLAWHEALKNSSDSKITLTDLIIFVTARALDQHPQINAKWEADKVVYNDVVNVGLAVAVEEGLQVPVVRGANTLTVAAIAQQRAGLVARATSSALSMEDVVGGTFSISNLGMFGVGSFSAIVNPPQAAILAIGQSEEKVVARAGEMRIEKRMQLTLSCDHRVIDGATGAAFMQTLVSLIEVPAQLIR